MDCETCNDLLLDLAYGELDEVRAAAVRKHLDGCASCKTAHARLTRTRSVTRQLVLAEAPAPSATLLAAIRHAAEANLATAGAGPDGGVAPVIPLDEVRARRNPGWLRRVGEVAMRRQVAMAAVFFLMVGVGIRYLPSPTGSQSPTAVDTSPPEVVPATDLRGEERAPQDRGAVTTPTPQAPSSPLAARSGRVAGPGPSDSFAHRSRAQSTPMAAPAMTNSVDRGNRLAHAGRTSAVADPSAPMGNAESGVERVWAANTRGSAGSGSGGAYGSSGGLAQGMAPAPTPAAAPPPAPAMAAPSRESQNAAQAQAPSSREQTIASLRQALQTAPNDEARRTVARNLHRELLAAGRVQEAADVQANYLTPASDTTGLGSAVAQSASERQNHPSNAAPSTAQPSTYRPAMPRPARRSVNMQSDYSNQSAY